MSDPTRRLRWEHWTAAALLAAMALVSFVNVLSRYLLHYSLAFTEEITVNLFVCMSVVGAGIAFERAGHLGMVSLYRMFPPGAQRAVTVAGAALAALLFVAVDCLLVKTIADEISVFHAVSPALGIPVWIYYAGVIALSPAVFAGICRGARRELGAIQGDGR